MLPPKWLLLLALPLLATMAIACGGSKDGSSDQGIKIEQGGASANGTPGAGAPIATLAAAPTPAGVPASADEVASLATNFGKVKSFRASIAQTSTAQPQAPASIQGTIEYSAPDKMHINVGSGVTAQDIICIGESGYYFKRGNDPWQKAPASSPPCRVNIGPADPKVLTEGIKKAAEDKTLNKGGQETVGGKKCQTYAQTIPTGATFEMCVADGLPIRLVSKDPQNTLTVTFSEFDKPLDIKAPI
jgi:hypothetical protein